MSYPYKATKPAVRDALVNELLAIADSKIVLGNWYANAVMNGRSLPDFAAMLAMCSTNYGHTRSIYQHLVNYGQDYANLERGRDASGIHSMNLLDKAPQGWEDFIVSTMLAEHAVWMMMSGFLNHPDRALAGLAQHIGQEAYFHFKYCDGWMAIIGEGTAERKRFAKAFAERYPLALQWFSGEKTDVLLDKGHRNTSVAKLKQAFVKEVSKASTKVGAKLDMPGSVKAGKDWRADARRAGDLPAGLFKVIEFKDPELAH